MAEPLDDEGPKPRITRPFWPEGWKPVEFVFLLFVFIGAALTDDYVAALGWPRWVRLLGQAVVLYVGLWLSGRWRRPTLSALLLMATIAPGVKPQAARST